MENLAKAILAVMKDVEGIDKTMTVGNGNSSYKGVPDQEVKKILGRSMKKHGLCVLPIDIQETTQIDRWEESYQQTTKQKQSVFTKVVTKYLLLHESGESQIISGYGHGVDSQDKGAGKATTYALKYAMLYTFFVPTGNIADSDNEESTDSRQQQSQQQESKVQQKPILTDVQFDNLIKMDKDKLAPLVPKYEDRFIIKPEWLNQLKAKIS